MNRKGLAFAIKSSVAPATFPGMPVRVWDGNSLQERIIAPAPEPGWWGEPDAWVWHPTSPRVREGLQWAHDRWHLSTNHHVTTVELKTPDGDYDSAPTDPSHGGKVWKE